VLGLALMLSLVVLPGVAWAAQNVYATDPGNNSVAQYAIGSTGGLSPLTPATVPAGSAPWAIVVSPDDKSAYVANLGGGVSQYNVDPATGALSPKTPAIVPTGGSLVAIAVTPDGRSVYVKDQNDGTVSQFSVDPVTGALSPKTPPTVVSARGTGGMAVSPDGESAYVVGGSSTSCCTVWQYDISSTTGALSPKSPANFTDCCGDPLDVAVTPDSKNAYVTAFSFVSFPPVGAVAQYNVDPVSGVLSPKTPTSVGAGQGPFAIVVSLDGKSAYVADFELPAPGFVRQYNIDPVTGALSPKTPASVTAPEPNDIALASDGKHAYVTNTDSISQYNIDPLTGNLSPLTPATTGSGGQGIAASPLPRAPTTKEQCKNGGWRNFPQFKNQGDCVSFVATNGKNQPG
jgi:6-phosphogluconolactonase